MYKYLSRLKKLFLICHRPLLILCLRQPAMLHLLNLNNFLHYLPLKKDFSHLNILNKFTMQHFSDDPSDSNSYEDYFFQIYAVEHIWRELESIESEILKSKADGKDTLEIVQGMHMVFTGVHSVCATKTTPTI